MITLLLFLSLLFSFDAGAQIIGSGVRQAPGVNCNDGSANAPGRKVDHADTDCSAPTNSWVAVASGIAVHANDGVCTTYAPFADSESEDTNAVHKAVDLPYTDGQCLYYYTGQTPGTRDIWGKVRVRDTTPVGERRIWASFAPFTVGYPSSARTDLNLTPTPSFAWVKIANDVTIAAEGALFIATTWALEFDVFYITTNDSATEGVSPAGAPVTGITHNATGTAASGAAISSLAPTITIAAGSSRSLWSGISHRTATNTITSVSSNVDGAFTLVNWTNNASVGCAVYRLIAPTVGAHTVTVSFSQAQNAVAGLVAYNGVDQSAPNGPVSTATGAGNPSLSVAGAADQRAIDHLCVSVDNADTVTVTSPQTQRYQKEVDITTQANRIDVWSDKQADSSTLMGATITGTRAYAQQTFTIKPPSAGGDPPTLGATTATLIGLTRLTIEANSSDASSLCTLQYDSDATGTPYAFETSPGVGVTGGKAIITVTGLAQNTLYFYRVKCNNGTDGFSVEGSSTTDSQLTRLGFTTREKAEWLQRSNVGPYKNTGDTSTNSPNDWTRIKANATAFIVAGASDDSRWAGNTGSTCMTTNGPTNRTYGQKMRDAAFVYFVSGDASYLAPVRTELLAQAATAGTDFTNTAKWCPASASTLYETANWMTKLAFAYDFIRADISAANQATLDAWFLGYGVYAEAYLDGRIDNRWPLRKSDSYATSPMAQGSCEGTLYMRANNTFAPCLYAWHMGWYNQMSSVARAMAIVAHIVDNSTLKTESERFFKEWLAYFVFYTNTDSIATASEYYRCCSTATNRFPTFGWSYVGDNVEDAVIIADLRARDGDPELYNYSTSVGHFGTEGGPKTLQKVIETHLKMADHSILRYGVKTTSEFGGGAIAANLIDTVYTGLNASGVQQNQLYVHDIGTAGIPNKFYNNAYFKSTYTRINSGMPAYPSSPSSCCTTAWEGGWSLWPGVLFMHGQMEGKVWPYPDP